MSFLEEMPKTQCSSKTDILLTRLPLGLKRSLHTNLEPPPTTGGLHLQPLPRPPPLTGACAKAPQNKASSSTRSEVFPGGFSPVCLVFGGAKRPQNGVFFGPLRQNENDAAAAARAQTARFEHHQKRARN